VSATERADTPSATASAPPQRNCRRRSAAAVAAPGSPRPPGLCAGSCRCRARRGSGSAAPRRERAALRPSVLPTPVRCRPPPAVPPWGGRPAAARLLPHRRSVPAGSAAAAHPPLRGCPPLPMSPPPSAPPCPAAATAASAALAWPCAIPRSGEPCPGYGVRGRRFLSTAVDVDDVADGSDAVHGAGHLADVADLDGQRHARAVIGAVGA